MPFHVVQNIARYRKMMKYYNYCTVESTTPLYTITVLKVRRHSGWARNKWLFFYVRYLFINIHRTPEWSERRKQKKKKLKIKTRKLGKNMYSTFVRHRIINIISRHWFYWSFVMTTCPIFDFNWKNKR